MARADRAHRAAQTKLRDATSERLASMLFALPEPRAQKSFDAYNAAAAKLVGGSQRRSAQLSIAYVTIGQRTVRPPSPARAISGVVVSRESPVTRSPMLRLWHEIDKGIETAIALQLAAGVAQRLASGDLQVAERAGLEEGAQSTGQRIVGWTKELSDDACPWCIEVAEGRYSSADAVPFHENDKCSVTPIFEGE
jgi:hypothetical protein